MLTSARSFVQKPEIMTQPAYLRVAVESNYAVFNGSTKRFIITEAVLATLRFSYGFVNSVMLFVVLKPFREPVKTAYKWLETKCTCNNKG